MILNAKGEPYERLLLLDVAKRCEPPSDAFLKIINKLVNPPWHLPLREKLKILDQFGRPIWRDHES